VRIIIDRFEGQFAVVELENRRIINIPKEIIPADAIEGTVLTIEIDHQETKRRNDGIERLMNDLWK